jgi:hypothetical protein
MLYAAVVRWCGRLVSGTGVRFDPRRIQGLLEMAAPETRADLQQFVCAVTWMRTSIPSFVDLISPLQDLLESLYAHAGGRRTKTAAARVPLSKVGWTGTHAKVFEECKDALSAAATLAHPAAHKRACLYTGASSFGRR